jgi:hypothetical protein
VKPRVSAWVFEPAGGAGIHTTGSAVCLTATSSRPHPVPSQRGRVDPRFRVHGRWPGTGQNPMDPSVGLCDATACSDIKDRLRRSALPATPDRRTAMGIVTGGAGVCWRRKTTISPLVGGRTISASNRPQWGAHVQWAKTVRSTQLIEPPDRRGLRVAVLLRQSRWASNGLLMDWLDASLPRLRRRGKPQGSHLPAARSGFGMGPPTKGRHHRRAASRSRSLRARVANPVRCAHTPTWRDRCSASTGSPAPDSTAPATAPS